MAVSVRSCLMAGVSAVVTTALVVVPSVSPPDPNVVASHAVRLSVAVEPLTAPSDDIPSLVDEIRMGIVPSLGAAFPTPELPGPSPTPNDFAGAIKTTYSAIEPWVRYGFEVATYAVGWIPWVGWLSPQIMIFYNFGERIVQSLVFNSADWLWGPLPFGQGLANVGRDSWDALVQLGIDQWNFWLPPLPPLPFTSEQTATPTASLDTVQPQSSPTPLRTLLHSIRERLGVPDLAARNTAAATPPGLLTHIERALGRFDTEAKTFRAAVRDAASDVTTGALRNRVPFGASFAPKVKPTKTAALAAFSQPQLKVANADGKRLRHLPGSSSHRPISPSAQGFHKRLKRNN